MSVCLCVWLCMSVCAKIDKLPAAQILDVFGMNMRYFYAVKPRRG